MFLAFKRQLKLIKIADDVLERLKNSEGEMMNSVAQAA
jgi:hypothetical protein